MTATETQSPASADSLIRSWEYSGFSIHQVGADLGGESFLLKTDDGATALFDTGFAFCAPQTLENIYSITGGRPVQKIVLTHSHYDHCAAAGYLLSRMPTTKVYASEHAARVFSSPGAIVTMSALNAERAASKGEVFFEDVQSNLVVDEIIGEGSTFSVGNLRFTTLSAVGHTRCSIAFWCEEEGLFVSSETSGVLCPVIPKTVDVPENISYMVDLPELVDYQSGIEHIERARKLPIRVFVATHYGCLSGSEVPAMWEAIDFWRSYIENMVMGMHNQGSSDEEIMAAYKEVFYWGGTAPYQPESAFDINVAHAIPAIIRACSAEGNASA